jgi:HEAT repeat protein
MIDSVSPHSPDDEISAQALRLLDLKDGIDAVPDTVALGPAAIPELERLLRGHPETVFEPRCRVADVIGMIGGGKAVDALHRALDDSLHRELEPIQAQAERAVINRIAINLGKLKDPRSRDPLLLALKLHPYAGVIHALAEFGETAAIPLIVLALNDDFAHDAAVAAIKKFGHAAIPALMEFLDERSVAAMQVGRATAARLLGELGATEAIAHLRRALRDASPMVRLGAAAALSNFPRRMETSEAVPVLLEFLAERKAPLREESMNALFNLRAHSEAALIGLVDAAVKKHDSIDSTQIRHAIALLGRMASQPAMEAISRLRVHPDRRLRFWALLALTRNRDPGSTRQLPVFLFDPHPMLRRMAIEGLRARGVEGAQGLIDALPRARFAMRRQILNALAEMGRVADQAIKRLKADHSRRGWRLIGRWYLWRLGREIRRQRNKG